MWQDSCWRLYCRRECARSMSWVAVNVTFTATHDIHCNSWHSLQLMTLTLSMSWDNAMRRWIWHSLQLMTLTLSISWDNVMSRWMSHPLQLMTLTATHDIDIVNVKRKCHAPNFRQDKIYDFLSLENRLQRWKRFLLFARTRILCLFFSTCVHQPCFG